MTLPGESFTEQAWLLTCNSNPARMLTACRGYLTRRKLLLFAVACCRRIWRIISAE